MINLYSGTPGSGKSLHQARDLYYWLQFDRPAIANFDIDTSQIKRCKGTFCVMDNADITPETLIDFSQHWFASHRFKEGSIRLYLDECQVMFNARSWDAKGRDAWVKFFTQHRKYGYDIYLIAQFDRMIDRQIRSLIEYEYIHRKVSNFGLKGKIFSLVSGGGLFVSVKVWYPLKEKVGSEFFHYKKRFSRLYNSYKTFSELPQNDTPKKQEPIVAASDDFSNIELLLMQA